MARDGSRTRQQRSAESEELAAALEAHREALSACRRCAGLLPPGVQPIVSLARAPRVMLVGQAPGKVEVGDRRPFAGRAGRTLFRWFERAGVDEPTVRARVYIAAVTRCYPGSHPAGRGDRVPGPVERENCRSWLDAELRLIRPRLLIPVGRLAVDVVLGKLPLDEVVGRVLSASHVGGESRVIALPHPSGASGWLNAPANKALLERALELLRAELAALRGQARGSRHAA